MSKKHRRVELIPTDKIESKIYMIRGRKVMFDRDLAGLYRVETKAVNQAVKRNPERFPEDFMFQLTNRESQEWLKQSEADSRSQFVTLKKGHNLKYLPYVFIEQGVAMLSSVLNSRAAILLNIQIIRTFVKLQQIALSYKDIRLKLEDMEKKYDGQFQVVFKAIKMLLDDKSNGGGVRRF